jgi:hypothetical protein
VLREALTHHVLEGLPTISFIREATAYLSRLTRLPISEATADSPRPRRAAHPLKQAGELGERQGGRLPGEGRMSGRASGERQMEKYMGGQI